MQSEFRVLNSHLQAMGEAQALATENRAFNQRGDGGYLATTFHAAGESALAINGSNEAGGYFQIDIARPVGEGVNAMFSMVDKLRAHFRPGTTITNQYGRVTISRISVHTLAGDNRAGRIVRIFWRSFS